MSALLARRGIGAGGIIGVGGDVSADCFVRTAPIPIIAFVDRRPIQVLPASLVNRIAAGEVIERPASVVKELVENAIDAGASQIFVEIEDGGRELIRVIDNGGGIPPGELPLAFAEHATSKLVCDEDLFRIATMGFRGEALASIGAVSHARVLSRTADNDAAYEIFNRGGIISDPQAAAGNVGTAVEIRNLFFNTPARRKFLKGSATESGHVSELLLRLALPHPGISFKLLSGGRTSVDLPATTAEQRLLAAWPDHFHEQRLPLDVRDAEIRVTGVVGLPELANPTTKYQFFYLNGRHIRDRFIQHAVREAYRGLTEPGRQPAAILLLTLPPQDVDVNVHPTKTEVRFRDSGRIHGILLAGIRERLLGSDLTPRALPSPAFRSDPPQGDMRQKLAEFFKQEYSSAPTSPPNASLTPHPNPPAFFSAPSPAPSMADNSASPSSPLSLSRSGAIQLHNAYLVAESDDGLVIIDQHALHERIMYEELLARLSRGPLESQRLLIPDIVPASARQIALLDQIQPLLQRLGMEIVPFGPDSLAVQAFPTFLERLDPGRFVRDLLERGEQELLDLHQEELLHELLDMMACKAAVKAGDPLTGPEIEALLARRELIERSSNCPHGRPTTLRLTLRDLEKQFKRTGF
jgi:DNA mismatch repair protein MutL